MPAAIASKLQIQAGQKEAAPLSKEQKSFNNLLKKIDAKRALLADWQQSWERFRQRYAEELQPLLDELIDKQHRLLQEWDAAYERKGTTKTERGKLERLIVALAEDVLAHDERDDVKQLFDKYNAQNYDEQEAEYQAYMKSQLESALGMTFSDDLDFSTPEDVLRELENHIKAQQANEEQPDETPRPKSRRETAQQARKEAEQKQLSQSIREVYRKLAAALHPDREPDPAEKERKTGLMQRANQAYEAGNLLALLELQLELEHITPEHLANISKERLKHYIKILKEQLAELENEIEEMQARVEINFDIYSCKPSILCELLEQDLVSLHDQQQDIDYQLSITADPKLFKSWLKTVRLSQHHF